MKSKGETNLKSLFKTTWLYFQSLIGIIVFLVLWHLLAIRTGLGPTPIETFARLATIWPTEIKKMSFIGHILVSLRRVLVSLLAGCLVGIPLGVSMGWSKKIRAIIGPIFETIRPIPPLAMVPLFTLWFGANDFARMMTSSLE